MNKLKAYLNKLNLDMVLSGIAGALILLIFRKRFEVLIYRFMLIFSPIIPDIFISAVYLDVVCAFIGGISGLFIYIIWNKRNKNILKWLLAVTLTGLVLINIVFLIDTTYTSKQLKRPLEELSTDSRFYPTDIHVSFFHASEGINVENGDRNTGESRFLVLNKNSSALNYIYEGVQDLSNGEFFDSNYSSLPTVSVSYNNNKKYKSIWISLDEEYSYQRLHGISSPLGVVRHNSEILHNRIDEILRKCRNFNEEKRNEFSASWFNAENIEKVEFKHIEDKYLLFDAMSLLQNYNPSNEEKNYYNEFFKKKPITVEDGDLIAIAYNFDTEEYEYEDVALYDRTKKLLILKDENNEIKFVEKDIDSIFE